MNFQERRIRNEESILDEHNSVGSIICSDGLCLLDCEKTGKGTAELGGTVSFTRSSYEEGSTGNLHVVLAIGYFVIPKLALEPKLFVGRSSISPED